MERNVRNFLSSIQKIINPQIDPSEASRILLDFQKEINSNFFCNLSNENLINAFKTIWITFFKSYCQLTTSNKILVSTDVGFFLSRICPFYPEQIMNSYAQSAKTIDFNPSLAPLLISSFFFITKFISPPIMVIFFHDIPIIEQFKTRFNDSSQIDKNKSFNQFSEHISSIIPNIKHVGPTWIELLFNFMMNDITPYPSRSVIKAISEIIMLNPKSFLSKSIVKLKKKSGKSGSIRDYISLYAFLFSSYQITIQNEENILPLAVAAYEIFNETNPANQDFDDALQVICVFPSIRVTINYSEPVGTLEGNLLSKNIKSVSISVHNLESVELIYENLKERSSFYRLPLPLEFLRPSQDDNILISASKFYSLAKIATTSKGISENTISEISSIFNNVLRNGFNDTTSAALNVLWDCYDFLKIDLFILKKLIFGPTRSWFQSMNVLSIIKVIKFDDIDKDFSLLIIDMLIDMILCKNEKLSIEALGLIQNFISMENHANCMQKVINKILFFENDSYRMIKLLPIITYLFKFFDDLFDFYWFIDAILEYANSLYNDFALITNIFELFSEMSPFNTSKIFFDEENSSDSLVEVDIRKLQIKSLIQKAYLIINISYRNCTGKFWHEYNIHDIMADLIDKSVKSYANINKIDIINNQFKNIQSVFKPMVKAIKFVFNCSKDQTLNYDLCQTMFKLFPLEISLYLEKNWSEFPNSQAFLSNVSDDLKYIENLKVHAVWCRIVVNNEYQNTAFDTISFLSFIADYFFRQEKSDDYDLVSNFAIFIMEIFSENEKLILKYISQYSHQEVSEIMMCASKSPHSNALIQLLSKEEEEGQLNILDNQKSGIIQSFNSQISKENLLIDQISKVLNDDITQLNDIDPYKVFIDSIYCGDEVILEKILNFFFNNNIKIDNFTKIQIPYYLKDVIVKWILNKCKQGLQEKLINWCNFTFDDVIDNLDTYLKPLSIFIIRNDQEIIEKILEYFKSLQNKVPDDLNTRKIRKHVLLNVSSIINKINNKFEQSTQKNKKKSIKELLQIFYLSLYQATSTKYSKVALRLITTIINHFSYVPKRLLSAFPKKIVTNEKVKIVSILEISLFTKEAANILTSQPHKYFLNSIRKFTHTLHSVSSFSGYFNYSLIKLSNFFIMYSSESNNSKNKGTKNKNALQAIGSDYLREKIEKNLMLFMASNVPSLMLNGLNQFLQCIYQVTWPEFENAMKNILNCLFQMLRNYLNNYPNSHQIPFIIENSIKVLKEFLICERYKDMSKAVCNELCFTFSIPSYSANYIISKTWIPFSIKYTKCDDYYERGINVDECIENIDIFKTAISCLQEYVSLISEIKEKTQKNKNDQTNISKKESKEYDETERLKLIINSNLSYGSNLKLTQDSKIIEFILAFTMNLNANSSPLLSEPALEEPLTHINSFIINPTLYLLIFDDLLDKADDNILSSSFIQFVKCIPTFEPILLALIKLVNINKERPILEIVLDTVADMYSSELYSATIKFLVDDDARKAIVECWHESKISGNFDNSLKSIIFSSKAKS